MNGIRRSKEEREAQEEAARRNGEGAGRLREGGGRLDAGIKAGKRGGAKGEDVHTL